MNFDLNKLPDNPVLLKRMLMNLSADYEAQLSDITTVLSETKFKLTDTEIKLTDTENKLTDTQKDLKEVKFRNEFLEERVVFLDYLLFGKKSEQIKISLIEKGQLFLFDEAERYSSLLKAKDSLKTEVKAHLRQKRGQREFPDYLGEEIREYDLSPEEKKCPCCGKERKCIGSDDTKRLKYIPAKVKIIVERVYKYGPCDCDDFFVNGYPEIKSAKKPPVLIPGCMADSSLLSQVITAKYADGLPLYRQEKIFKRHDLLFSRATLSNWVMRAAEKCEPVLTLFEKDIRGGPLINMDETRVQVLKEPGKSASSLSYMWIRAGCTADYKRIIIFKYSRSRSGKTANELLDGFNGYLQTDGYQGYNLAVKEQGLIHVGCLAHIRRKFYTVIEIAKKLKVQIDSAEQALKFIAEIYAIEKELRNRKLSSDKFLLSRKKKLKPVLDEFYSWLIIKQKSITPASSVGKAVNYAVKEWNKFVKFLDSEYLTPDNNIAENAIRPFVIGRKNWLFSNTPRGADSSALLYSLIETAKANGHEPFKYLYFLFENLPLAENQDEISKLLPYNISSEDILAKIDMG